jgi:Xaa-Pro dipeptidase
MAASSASSLTPPAVPMELHAGNRDRLVAALRDHLSASARPPRGLVLLQVGPTYNPSVFSAPLRIFFLI